MFDERGKYGYWLLIRIANMVEASSGVEYRILLALKFHNLLPMRTSFIAKMIQKTTAC